MPLCQFAASFVKHGQMAPIVLWFLTATMDAGKFSVVINGDLIADS